MTNLELLMKYMEQNQYFIGNDLLAKYNELLQKEKKEQLTLTDVVHSGFYCMDAENSNGSCHCPKQCNSCVGY
jgi:hypothetical protein